MKTWPRHLMAFLLWAAALPAALAGETRVIVALGDSTTAGTPFFRSPLEAPPDGEGDAQAPYAAELGRRLPGWRIVNRGINGERTDEILARFQRDALSQDPDYVIILAGVNDVYQGVAPAKIKKNLAALYARCAKAHITPIAASILPFTLATPEQSRRIAGLNTWIQQEARRRKMPFCDLHAVAADPKDHARLRGSPDGLHPDKDVYRAMGAALAELIIGLRAGR